jgi:parallel beta-helix repeat protein
MKIILFAIAILFSPKIFAATYYVAINGNDSNNGAIATPWLSIPKAMRSLRAGDTLFIRDGTYSTANYGNSISDSYGCQSGCPTSWDNATTITNYPGETVTISSSGFNLDGNLAPGGISYIIFKGETRGRFILDGRGTNTVGIRWNNNVNHIRMQRLIVKNYGSHGLQGGSGKGIHDGIQILDNEITNNGADPLLDHGIYLTYSANALVQGNYLHGNANSGLWMNQPGSTLTSNIFERNLVVGRSKSQNVSGGIGFEGSYGTIVRNNVIIGRGNEAGTLYICFFIYPSTNALIYNNSCYGTQVGVDIDPFNTGTTGLQVVNNIFNAVADMRTGHGGSGTIFNKNICPVGTSECGSNAILTNNVGFVSPGFDLHLSVNSVAINAGASLSIVTNDFDGVSRPQGGTIDIGAFEYFSGSSTQTKPKPPTNLQAQ